MRHPIERPRRQLFPDGRSKANLAKVEAAQARGAHRQAGTHEWTGKFDGKDYPVTGDLSADARSLKLVSPGRYALSNSKGGKTVLTGTVEFSAGDKTRTLTTHTTDATGKKITSIAVYERQ